MLAVSLASGSSCGATCTTAVTAVLHRDSLRTECGGSCSCNANQTCDAGTGTCEWNDEVDYDEGEFERPGVATVLVEQRVDAVLSVADRVSFIENGHNLETLDADALRRDHAIIERHLGV